MRSASISTQLKWCVEITYFTLGLFGKQHCLLALVSLSTLLSKPPKQNKSHRVLDSIMNIAHEASVISKITSKQCFSLASPSAPTEPHPAAPVPKKPPCLAPRNRKWGLYVPPSCSRAVAWFIPSSSCHIVRDEVKAQNEEAWEEVQDLNREKQDRTRTRSRKMVVSNQLKTQSDRRHIENIRVPIKRCIITSSEKIGDIELKQN